MCACSVPGRVDAVINTEQWNVLQSMVGPSLRNASDGQNLPCGSLATWAPVMVLSSGEWQLGLRY